MTQTKSLFFYGTLCHPKVLQRVVGNIDKLEYHVSILRDHARYRVLHADYPGAIPAVGKQVKGMFVRDLSAHAISRLDAFEGEEYERKQVMVESIEHGTSLECEVYLYTDHPETKLERVEWDFDQFVKEKLALWIGEDCREFAMLENDGTNGRYLFPTTGAAM